MGLTKRLYKNHKTVITGENLNDIQDAILALEQLAGIVPGEGETTKIINVINAAGTMAASTAAGLPDGLYWVANPITFQDELKTDSFQITGMAEKDDLSWIDYGSGTVGTTDENGVLLNWLYLGFPEVSEADEGKVLGVQGGKWALVDADRSSPVESVSASADGTYQLAFEDGSTAAGTVTFDDQGLPTGLTDDQGNSATFDESGWPASVSTPDGSVEIVGG